MDDGAEKDHGLCRVRGPHRSGRSEARILARLLLPRHSEIAGQLMATSQVLQVEVWRGAAQGQFQTFSVPRQEHQTVLDVVTQIQREQDATLAYRFACRVGMCGSCAMVVNGCPRW